eukprot:5212138-Pyramimonas_sp.AAC.2
MLVGPVELFLPVVPCRRHQRLPSDPQDGLPSRSPLGLALHRGQAIEDVQVQVLRQAVCAQRLEEASNGVGLEKAQRRFLPQDRVFWKRVPESDGLLHKHKHVLCPGVARADPKLEGVAENPLHEIIGDLRIILASLDQLHGTRVDVARGRDVRVPRSGGGKHLPHGIPLRGNVGIGIVD